MPLPTKLPPMSVKYVLLGMLREGGGSRSGAPEPNDPPNDSIEFFWPAEHLTVFETFERCLVQLERELGIAASIVQSPRIGVGGVFRSLELAQHIDGWYGAGDGLHYGMFPPRTDVGGERARVSFLKGILLRQRQAPVGARWSLAATPVTWGVTVYRVLVDLGCDGATLRYGEQEGSSQVLTFPQTDWTMRLHARDLPW